MSEVNAGAHLVKGIPGTVESALDLPICCWPWGLCFSQLGHCAVGLPVAEHSASPELQLWAVNLWVCLVWGGGGHPEAVGAAGSSTGAVSLGRPCLGLLRVAVGSGTAVPELTGLGSHRGLEVLQGEVPKTPQTGWSCQQGDSWLWQWGWGELRGEGLQGPQQRPGRAGKGWVMAVLLLEGWIEALWELQPSWESREMMISF